MKKYGSSKRTTSSRLEKVNKVYEYLIQLVNDESEMPNLTELHKTFNSMHISNLMEVLKDLDKADKIVYRKGKILAVKLPKTKVEHKEEKVKKEVQLSMSDVKLDMEEKYDKAVKDLIADYILKSNVVSKEDMIKYINGIMNITDKLKEKLF